jgi:NADH pyrophosphatase NudC (nudix superfamily)
MNIGSAHKYHFDKCTLHPIFGKDNIGRFKHTKEAKEKISRATKGRKLSEQHKKILLSCNKGKIVSEETKLKQRNTKLGKVFTEQHKQNLRLSHVGKIVSEETREKKRQKWKEIEDVKCPYCDVIGRGGVMVQYHFENCKHNPNYIPQIKEIVICPHCGKQGKKGRGMKRYHFDNCKHKIFNHAITHTINSSL